MRKMYTINDIDDYKNRLTAEQAEKLVRHCNNYNIKPRICAWYDDMKDWYQDWVYDHKFYKTKAEAKIRYEDGITTGEFIRFKDGQIVRLEM